MTRSAPDDASPEGDTLLHYLTEVDQGKVSDRRAWLAQHPEAEHLKTVFLAEEAVAPVLGILRPSAPGKPVDPDRTSSQRLPPTPGLSVLAGGTPNIPELLILDELGRGGMGVVYLAKQERLERLVAVKMLLAAPDEQDAKRFDREGQAIARLKHECIVQIYATGTHSGLPYLVMEYVPGGSLKDVVEEHGPWPARQAAELLHRLARAIQFAHERGIVHRDLKPANVLMQPSDDPARANDPFGGTPRIADFGLARKLDVAPEVTRAGVILGTPSFMAPEQALGEPVGPAADVFGLGGILYFILTGQPPFPGDTTQQVLQHARAGQVTPLGRIAPGVDPALAAICHRALAREVAHRYASAAEMVRDLERYLGRGVGGIRGNIFVWLAAGLAAVLFLGVGLSVWFQARKRPSIVALTPDPAPPARPLAVPDVRTVRPRTTLEGDLRVALWARDGKGKRGVRIEQPGTLPARREMVHIEAKLGEPAYVYLLWIDCDGEIVPLYPWNRIELKVADASVPPPVPSPLRLLHSPASEVEDSTRGWYLDEKDGLETILMLARRTPLPAEVNLARLIGKLPQAPLGHPDEFVLRRGEAELLCRNRGLQKVSGHIDDSLLQAIKRLDQHFELVRYVRFAHKGSEE